ncbi:MAG: SDR family NAD(P)-dependent oxidoreductase [Peptococcaceae bacterium]|nr:SDR family NAD(P)-dependent oxidoreductase [Peptococcaceae bacterium]
MDIKGKVCLITGASSGIGKALAQALSAHGAKLALLARREQELQKLADQLGALNPDILLVPTDVTDRSQVEAAVTKVFNHFGQIDLLVNNAGLGYFGSLEKMSMDDFDQVIKTNIYGLLHMSQAAIPYLKRSHGIILNISSGLSKRSLPYLSAYGGTKSMVDALSDGMRLELKPYGIRVLNYCPPETDTEFHRNSRRQVSMEMGGGTRKMAKVETVVASILKVIASEQREKVEGHFLHVMNFFAPKMLDTMFYKGMVQKLHKD